MEGPSHGPSTGTPLTSKYCSNLPFVKEIKFLWGEDPQPREVGCVFMEIPFFQKLQFLLQNCFHGTFPSGRALPPPPAEQGLTVFHRIFITEFLSQGFFYHRIFITGFFPLWSESQQKLWSGRQILLLLHAQRQKWKDAKKWIKYDISHFQVSKLSLFIRFSSSSGGIFTLTVWKTSYFSVPASEFPETMVHLTVPCVAKQADKNYARYLRYQRSSPNWQQFKWIERESTKSRQSCHIKKNKFSEMN